MAFPDAAVSTAVPVTIAPAVQDASTQTSAQFDPANPAALGYDPATSAFAAARGEARGDPELERTFHDRLRGETTRFRAWAEVWRRRGGGGAGWSGPTGGFDPVAPHALLEQARTTLARSRAWARSPAGVLARRLDDAEAAMHELSGALAQARTALERAGGDPGTGAGTGSFIEARRGVAVSATGFPARSRQEG